jgi:two-component system, OmpR family, sensor histidine kinase BaeS
LLQETVADFAEKLRGARLSVTTGASPARAGVQGDAERLRQVFANLIENSVRYTGAGGTLHLHAAIAGETLQVIIDDSAPGVADDCRNRLGERFFRVDALRNRQPGGAGLGLALSRQIIEAHDGRLTFAASPLGGLRAVIALPLER